MGKLYYIASPYTHPDEKLRQQRFEAVSNITVQLLNLGIYTFSPIAYNHPMVKYNLPTDWNFWKEYDTVFLERCDGLIVVKLDGWEQSVGISAEISIAEQLNLKIFYIDPHNLNSSIADLL